MTARLRSRLWPRPAGRHHAPRGAFRRDMAWLLAALAELQGWTGGER